MANKEVVILLVIPVCSMLFALGGTGHKWARRFLLPIILAIGLILLGSLVWKATISCMLLCIALHFGYGEGKSWAYRFMVGCSYAIPSVLLGFTIWQVICPIVFISLFALSNWRPIANEFKWKYVEAIVGLLIAITYIEATI